MGNRRDLLLGLGSLGLAGACAPLRPVAAASSPLPGAGELEAEFGGRLGLHAARGGRSVAWRGDERFTYCSTFKLFLAAATLERVDRGQERLDASMTITTADMVPHAPVTEPAVGGRLSVERLCQAAVELSDNPAANLLIRRMGGLDAWRDWWPTLGDRTTRVDRLEPELNLPDPRLDTTTPAQTVRNLRTVLLGERLSAGSRDRLEGWLLASPTGSGRLKAAAPAGAQVAHKTGTWSSEAGAQTNDIGLIRLPAGDPVLIAVYYASPVGVSPATREAVIAKAARMALEILNG